MSPIDKSLLRQHVETLTKEPRVPGTPHHNTCSDYIAYYLKDLGYDIRFQISDAGTNVIAEKGIPGAPLLVIGAHYDSVVGSPGADDNASGVAALLELARVFSKRSRSSLMVKKLVQFVAYDKEELGLLGSTHHVKLLGKNKPFAMLSLEMLGYTGDKQTLVPGVDITRSKGDFLAIVANKTSKHLLEAFEAHEELAELGAFAVEQIVIREGTQASELARLSDHGAFWSAGWPALLVTDTAFLRNPHYHQPSDLAETLDYDFLERSTWKVALALGKLGEM